MKFELYQTKELLTTHAGLAMVGNILPHTRLVQRLNKMALPGIIKPQISNSDCAIAYIGLLCQGKNDFDHIEAFREDSFFQCSLGLKQVPSSPTLRQRFDKVGNHWNGIIMEESARMLKYANAAITPCHGNLVPLDIDVSPFDNSNTKKEGVSLTYKGHDGYAPIFSYLGVEGYCINTELREGKDHSQNNTAEYLSKTIKYAKLITEQPLLVRMDSGYDSLDNIKVCLSKDTQADFIIKRNLRRESPQAWLITAQQHGICCLEREGKNVYVGDLITKRKDSDKKEYNLRMVFMVIERTIVEPEITIGTGN